MNPRRPHLLGSALLCAATLSCAIPAARALDDAPGRWSTDKAAQWEQQHGWLRGCNYIPSNAINQLEMWQSETWSPQLIDTELGWAEGLGFNSVRVFLHDLPYQQDQATFLRHVDQFLALADKHHIGVLFAVFDSCWYPQPKLGQQPAPLPHVHNSGWVQSPANPALHDPAQYPRLHAYVTGIIKHFANDRRIVGWDVWNEPDNRDGGEVKRPGLEPKNNTDTVDQLLPQVFAWAREANPTQPLTSGVWDKIDWSSDDKLSPTEKIQLGNSDVISFHNYGNLPDEKTCVNGLRRFNRPLVQTEYMARPRGSTFDPIMGYQKAEKVDCYCWGFVSGKTQTIYPWDSWTTKYMGEPPLWFHDILRTDGTPYKPAEVAYIRQTTGKTP